MRPLEFGTDAQYARAACDHEGVSFGSPVQSGPDLPKEVTLPTIGCTAGDLTGFLGADRGDGRRRVLGRIRRRTRRATPPTWASLPSGAAKPSSACLTVKRHDTTVASVLSRMGTTTPKRLQASQAKNSTASCALAHDRPGTVVPLELEPKPLFGDPGLVHPAMAGRPRFANGGHASAGGALRAALHFNACLAETGWLSRTPDCSLRGTW